MITVGAPDRTDRLAVTSASRRNAREIPNADDTVMRRQMLRFMARFAAALIVPLVLLCAIVGHAWVRAEQGRMIAVGAAQAAGAASDIEQYLSSRIASLRALATSPSLDRGDFARFERQARELLDHDGVGLVLRDTAGAVQLNTIAQFNAQGDGHGFLGDAIALRNGSPYVSDLVENAFGERHAVVIVVPVLREGTVRYTLDAMIHPNALIDVVRHSGVGPEQLANVADRQGRAIARTERSAVSVGQVVPGFAQRDGARGLWSGLNARDVPVRISYERIPSSGWMVSVSMTEAAFQTPLVRSLRWLAGLTLLVVVGTALLILPLVLQRLAVQRDVHNAHRRLQETSELLRLANDAAGAGSWEWEPRLDRLSLAPASARMHGLPVRDDASDAPVVIDLERWKSCVVPDDLPQIWAQVKAMGPQAPTNSVEFRTIDPATGARRWIQSLCRVFFDPVTGEAIRYVGLHIDVTVRREAEEALRASEALLRVSEERLSLALDSGQDGLLDVDLVQRITWVSDGWLVHLGYDVSVMRPLEFWLDAVHPDDAEEHDAILRAHFDGVAPDIRHEHRLRRADGVYIWVLLRARVTTRGSDGSPVRLVGTLIDVSTRKQAEARIAHMALHDDLTGLPNRRVFCQHLDRVLANVRNDCHAAAVLVCDLDGFKAINDTLGHDGGDRLLCIVAERLRASVCDHDTVARLGGDEFALILERVDGARAIEDIACRVREAVQAPIEIHGVRVEIGIGVGAAMVPQDGIAADDLFKRADLALYEAKAAGRDSYRLYEPGLAVRHSRRSLLAVEMREAIRRGDFHLVYQPVVDAMTEQVVGFEALMRWHHPDRGPISPSDFIPVAEQTGLIVQLGAWALDEACREAMSWPDRVRVAVNVSAVQLRDGFEETVLAALSRVGLPPGRLNLEVTESALMADPEAAVALLHRLRGLGSQISLDDFGTGYSSLSYLRRFPFDKLKIDRAFIRDIADPDTAAIVRAVVCIGERLGMGIVAEGVETAEQLRLVRREGCMQVQGFYFSRPLGPDDARVYVRNSLARAA